MVHEILESMHAVGKENAVSRKTLAALTGLSDRSMRGEIEKERRSGILICSHMETGGGILPSFRRNGNQRILQRANEPDILPNSRKRTVPTGASR